MRLHQVIADWCEGDRAEADLAKLLSLIARLASDALQEGTTERCQQLADAFKRLLDVHPLPIIGAHDFLYTLDSWLRDESAWATWVKDELPAVLTALVLHLSSAELNWHTALGQFNRHAIQMEYLPRFKQAAMVLGIPTAPTAARVDMALWLDEQAAQGVEGMPDDSPLVDALAAHRALAALLRGEPFALDTLGQPWRALVQRARDNTLLGDYQ
jgi:hypothetical protein